MRYDVCLLFFYCKKRLEYFDLLNHRTSTFVLLQRIINYSGDMNSGGYSLSSRTKLGSVYDTEPVYLRNQTNSIIF